MEVIGQILKKPLGPLDTGIMIDQLAAALLLLAGLLPTLPLDQRHGERYGGQRSNRHGAS